MTGHVHVWTCSSLDELLAAMNTDGIESGYGLCCGDVCVVNLSRDRWLLFHGYEELGVFDSRYSDESHGEALERVGQLLHTIDIWDDGR